MMISKIIHLFKIICNIFHDENKEYDKKKEAEFIKAVKRKQETLQKFGGKMHVSKRGRMSIKFKTVKGSNAYYQHVLNSVKSKASK